MLSYQLYSACDNTSVLPNANYITPPIAIAGEGKNVTLACIFHGDVQKEKFHVCWNNSDSCLKEGPKYDISSSAFLNCTSTGQIPITNSTSRDSLTYTCYTQSSDASSRLVPGKSLSTNISELTTILSIHVIPCVLPIITIAILKDPVFIKLPGYKRQSIHDVVNLEWTIAGDERYIDPYILVNGTTNLSNITSNFVLHKNNKYHPPTSSFDMILDLYPTDFSPGTHQFQLCAPFSSQVEMESDYNKNPNCSDETSVTLIIPGLLINIILTAVD